MAILVMTGATCVVGVLSWWRLSTPQRLLTVYLSGSMVLGIVIKVTALRGIQNHNLMNMWSLWFGCSAGLSVAACLPARQRQMAGGLLFAWAAAWAISQVLVGVHLLDQNLHPILCALTLGIGSAAFGRSVDERISLWENPQALLILAVALGATADVIAWGSLRVLIGADLGGARLLWTVRNLVWIVVNILFLKVLW